MKNEIQKKSNDIVRADSYCEKSTHGHSDDAEDLASSRVNCSTSSKNPETESSSLSGDIPHGSNVEPVSFCDDGEASAVHDDCGGDYDDADDESVADADDYNGHSPVFDSSNTTSVPNSSQSLAENFILNSFDDGEKSTANSELSDTPQSNRLNSSGTPSPPVLDRSKSSSTPRKMPPPFMFSKSSTTVFKSNSQQVVKTSQLTSNNASSKGLADLAEALDFQPKLGFEIFFIFYH